jgi:hypothetical protein
LRERMAVDREFAAVLSQLHCTLVALVAEHPHVKPRKADASAKCFLERPFGDAAVAQFRYARRIANEKARRGCRASEDVTVMS